MRRTLIPLAVFALLAVVLARGLSLNPREIPSPLVGRPAPAFAATTLADPGRTVSHDDLLGRVTVVNVWASWCAACLAEHPYLTELDATVTTPIVGINYKDTREDASRWLARHGNVYDLSVFDGDGKVGFEWGVYGVPETFILDRSGRIRYKHIGPIDADDLRDTILPWIRRLEADT